MGSSAIAAGYGEEALLEAASPPGTFHLTRDEDEETVTYDDEKPLRICVKDTEHAVGIEVRYDGKKHVVNKGDCFEFEAKKVSLKPAAELQDDWTLEGEIEDLSP